MSGGSVTVRVVERDRLRLMEQLDMLTLPPKERRKFLRKVIGDIRRQSKENVRAQRTVDGAPMPPRKHGRRKRKMMKGLGRTVEEKVTGDYSAEVGWRKSGPARTAYRHHHGVPEDWSRGRARKAYGTPDYKKAATKRQARSLIREGYRAPRRKKRGKGITLKRVSKKWIEENMSLGQAGVILRLMRTGTRRGKTRWTVDVPARPFLGVPAAEADRYVTDLARQALAGLR